jgi:cyclopropane fatty-acyl-phospholipid synthase-like methyltransferase
MKDFSDQDVINYYDLTQQHMRWFWKLDDSMGLHYGVWEAGITNLADAIRNTDRILAKMGDIKPGHKVLDAGCGVGGSSILIAKEFGAHCTGITLSEKQVKSATAYAARHKVSDLTHFEVNDYFNTGYPDNSFDIAWAMESMATAPDKDRFLKEMNRVLKPGGKLLVCDYYKPHNYDVADYPCMQDMLHNWIISDILTIEEKKELAGKNGFELIGYRDTTKDISKSVKRIYRFALAGKVGTKLYALKNPKVSSSSKNHYKSGLGQLHGYKKGLWNHVLWAFEKTKTA